MASTNNIVRTVTALRKKVSEWRKNGQTVALVPTMGALHEGHLSLVQQAQKKADRVIVSIFVNPTQFGKNEDLSKYPRQEKEDKAKLDQLGTDLIFAPRVDQMYPEGFSTSISVSGITEGLCGGSRPGHFDGVAIIVTKLLLQTLPDIAIFGEKDYQQLQVIKRFATDLDIPVRIEGGAIVREADGLAMSSRNSYLTKTQRETAPLLYKKIKGLAKSLPKARTPKKILDEAVGELNEAGFKVDYLELRDTKTLEPIKGKITAPARLFVAAFLGKTRLIDNIRVSKVRS